MAPPTDPGTLLATTHRLPGGERLRLRLARPSDAPRVRAFLDALSPGSRHRRFGTAAVGAEAVRHFTFYDPRSRIVIAATLPVDGHERIAALGDVALLETGLAELGLVVADDRRGEGVGGVVAEALGWLAAQRGATHAKAEMVERNPAMERLMARLGPTAAAVEHGRPVVYARIDGLPAAARAA